jgi:hypothetical protein
MFGINEKGEQCSILCTDFKPFFYAKVDDNWTIHTKTQFVDFIKRRVGPYYAKSINECKIIKRKKLYGFDGGKEHKFILLTFNNIQTFNKVKNLWFDQERKLLVDGLNFKGSNIYLYEANIPPLLRFFHMKDISPSGWVALPNKHTIVVKHDKKSNCQHEFTINYKYIIPLNNKETRVPYKIMSFDIEASSSHGDFPVPVKTYKKLATNIIEYIEKIEKIDVILNNENCKSILNDTILSAFGYKTMIEIELVYPKNKPKDIIHLNNLIQKWFLYNIDKNDNKNDDDHENIYNETTIEEMFENMHTNKNEDFEGYNAEIHDNDEEDEYGLEELKASTIQVNANKNSSEKKLSLTPSHTIIDVLCDKKIDRNEKDVSTKQKKKNQ